MFVSHSSAVLKSRNIPRGSSGAKNCGLILTGDTLGIGFNNGVAVLNYYERHLGDYAKDTAHLSMLEHGAYGLLLDRYYGTEQGIPADQVHRIARARTKEERAAVDVVLSEFFKLKDGVWINGRAEEEINKIRNKIKAAQENGKRGGRPKSNQNKTEEKPSGFSVGYETETQQKAHQTPDTIHQTPLKAFSAKRKKTSLPDETVPKDSHIAKAREHGLIMETEIEAFRNYHKANGSLFMDWDAALHTWLQNAVKFSRKGGRNGSDQKHERRQKFIDALTGNNSAARTVDGTASALDSDAVQAHDPALWQPVQRSLGAGER